MQKMFLRTQSVKTFMAFISSKALTNSGEYIILCGIDIIPFLDAYLGVATLVYSILGMMPFRHFNKFAHL